MTNMDEQKKQQLFEHRIHRFNQMNKYPKRLEPWRQLVMDDFKILQSNDFAPEPRKPSDKD